MRKDPEPLEDGRRARFERVAVETPEGIFEIGEARRVPLTVIDDGDLSPAGPAKRDDRRSSRVEDDLRVVEELVLAKHTDPRAAENRHAAVEEGSSPAKIFKNVVLPEPFAPTRP